MVDIERIEELRDEIGEEDMRAVLGIYREEADRIILGLGAHADEGAYGKAIHFLRSGALNLGLQGFADHADSLMRTPRAHRDAAAEDLHRSLQRAYAVIERLDIAA